jgi:hypothetical protein
VLTRVAFALAVLTAVFAGAGSAAPAREQVAVEPWIALELDLIAARSVNPPRAARALALVSRGMYDAAATERGLANRKSAVAGAAATVLAHLFPNDVALIDSLAAEFKNADRRPGFARGVEAGLRMVARAQNDGSSAAWTGTVPMGPGLWTPTPPAFVSTPLEPLAGTWRTWNLASGSQFRPGPPPAFGGPQFAAELEEVYDVARELKAEQRAIALFWADGAGTATPPGHWNRIALELVADADLDLLEATRLFAALNTAQADAFIACWDAKFTYWSMRPVSAIRASLDPDWTPMITTPPFPSYVSGHSTTSGAASTVLAAFFTRQAEALHALAAEAAVSRLYGGIHFRSDNDAGLTLGRRVAAVALAAYND